MAAPTAPRRAGEGVRSSGTGRGLRSLVVVDSTPAVGVKPWVGLTLSEVGRREGASPRFGASEHGKAASASRVWLVTGALIASAGGLVAVWRSPLIGLALVCAGAFAVLAARHMRQPKRRAASLASDATIPVRRDGRLRELHAAEVVPGDVIILAPGRRVPADAMLVDSDGLVAEEPAAGVTPDLVEKHADPGLFEDAPLAHRAAVVFAGSMIREGYGTAIVMGGPRGPRGPRARPSQGN